MKKHQHKEAFCLMWYKCDACGHQERIWNSRDGVTPFCMGCPSCNLVKLQHWEWELDKYAPDHILNGEQRYWRDGTKEEARASLKRRFAHFEKEGQAAPQDIKDSMYAEIDNPSEFSEWQKGWPFLDRNIIKIKQI